MKRESAFQSELIAELKSRFPGCIVLKNDPTYLQGFPDLLVLYSGHWAALECKRSARESHQPNQDWYVEQLDAMSYAAFIFPENKEQILYDLQQAFKSRRPARVSERKRVSLD